MRKARLAFLTAMLGLFLLPVSASATTFQFRGIVQSGSDDDGVFGPFGKDLADLPYILKIDFDAAKGGAVPGAPLPYSQGGDGADSSLTVELTIGGRRLALYDFGSTTSYLAASVPLDMIDFGSGGSSFAFEYQSYNLDGYFNTLQFGRTSGANGGMFSASFGDPETTSLVLGLGTFVSAGSVPEPAGWMLMIVGMGCVGARLRSRRPGYAASYG